jgi:BCD family chlorophyll transporter-like MFS transporter
VSATRTLGWLGIVRLGLVQTALGSIVVLTTSTLNRVMVVELALPALLPGVLVALHYAVQVARPRFGYGSDTGRRRTPWIVGGITVLGLGGILAAVATALMSMQPLGGIALAVIAFLLIGAGVGASGTCLLVLLASGVAPERRAAAASITWIMMIAGFAVTAGLVGAFLDPFSLTRLVAITSIVAACALVLTLLALRGLEDSIAGTEGAPVQAAGDRPAAPGFVAALVSVLREDHTRRFGMFVFISMLAYSAQDLILEPFAGAVFGLTPGESTQLGGIQHTGVLIGMLFVALLGQRMRDQRSRMLGHAVVGGCAGSGLLLGALSVAGYVGAEWPLSASVFALGIANGCFAVAAIGSMMALVSQGHKQRSGTRMGVWGAAQAVAFAVGGIIGTGAVDLVRALTGSVLHAYSVVFFAQAVLFGIAAFIATRLWHRRGTPMDSVAVEAG